MQRHGSSTGKYVTTFQAHRQRKGVKLKNFDAKRAAELLDAGLMNPKKLSPSQRRAVMDEMEKQVKERHKALKRINAKIARGDTYMDRRWELRKKKAGFK